MAEKQNAKAKRSVLDMLQKAEASKKFKTDGDGQPASGAIQSHTGCSKLESPKSSSRPAALAMTTPAPDTNAAYSSAQDITPVSTDSTTTDRSTKAYDDYEVPRCLSTFYVHAALGSRQAGGAKPIATSLYLYQSKPEGDVTYHCRRVPAAGADQSWLVSNNIDRVFAKFRSEGRCTIRLRKPAIDIAITKADPTVLTKFLDTLYNIHTHHSDLYLPSKDRLARLIKLNQSKELHVKRMQFDAGRALPRQFPTSLESLKILHHALRKLPVAVLNVTTLTALDLSHNEFSGVPLELNQLTGLVSLKLADNQLSAWPVKLTLPALRRLDLSNNRLTSLPRSIAKYKLLESLLLDNNQLKYIPSAIARLKRLRILKLAHNQLRLLPGELAVFKSANRRLQQLHLDGNAFQAIPSHPALKPNRVLSLFELSARRLLRKGVHVPDASLLPEQARTYLKQASRCSRCSQPFVECHQAVVRGLELAQIAEHYTLPHGIAQLPAVHRLCSFKCTRSVLT
eukprot:TRINITY_DN8148_c0_g1_i1.p1 TRINITY_DN8148_c0_g1~~TRINITY_DN8148_c0_g1_i1.p1  ORF type:complete len:511 (+),score=92.52 TRINITY_DN8148_c0_g1_i1:156-1688(+)